MLVSVILAAQTVLTVFAAASLNAAFPEVGRQFEAAHPGVTVRFDFDGSQVLDAQLAQGAQADVFASADQRWMETAKAQGLVDTSTPFATNSLVIVASDRSSLHAPQDLAKPGLRVVLCADAVPCGRYARTLLANMDADPAFGNGYEAAVLRNVVSEEQNVEDVYAKVSLGEADGGIVYHSDMVYRADVLKTAGAVHAVDLPKAYQPATVYPIAPLTHSVSKELAAEFVVFVRSTQGQQILERFGFGPAP
jgi:molybdate transport system substrate-binding protein